MVPSEGTNLRYLFQLFERFRQSLTRTWFLYFSIVFFLCAEFATFHNRTRNNREANFMIRYAHCFVIFMKCRTVLEKQTQNNKLEISPLGQKKSSLSWFDIVSFHNVMAEYTVLHLKNLTPKTSLYILNLKKKWKLRLCKICF